MELTGPIVALARLGELATAVRELADQVALADGAAPLDEAQLLDLDGESSEHVMVYGVGGELVGYAQITAADARTGDASAAIVVGPLADRAGLAGVLLGQAELRTEPGHLVVWSRSAGSPVGPVAVHHSYRADRVLLTMARPLAPADSRVSPIPGVQIRAFVSGADDAAWLAVNAAAFAAHPEQGAWTTADLARRIAAPWFDAAGFLLAIDDETGALLGFHWTKLHPGSPPVGEVYVIGTAPKAQGRGLGRQLLRAGLRHLQTTGVEQVILYVDEANAAAVRLYERTGFTTTRRQVQYRRP